MSELSTFEIVAGTSSILALLIILAGSARKKWRAAKQKREEAEQKFEQMLARLKSAGSSVSARTDLGFFVLLELGSLRDLVSEARHSRTLCLLAAFSIFIVAVITREAIANAWITIAMLAASLMYMLLFVMSDSHLTRLEKYANSYESRLKEFWKEPVDKRADNTSESA